MSDSQSAPKLNHNHTTKKKLPDISTNKVKSETSINNMQPNSFINLIRKTCIKLICQDVIKINYIRSKQTSHPLIQIKTLQGMHPTWLYDTDAALTCISMEFKGRKIMQKVQVYKNLAQGAILGIDAIDNLGITYLSRTK